MKTNEAYQSTQNWSVCP